MTEEVFNETSPYNFFSLSEVMASHTSRVWACKLYWSSNYLLKIISFFITVFNSLLVAARAIIKLWSFCVANLNSRLYLKFWKETLIDDLKCIARPEVSLDKQTVLFEAVEVNSCENIECSAAF